MSCDSMLEMLISKIKKVHCEIRQKPNAIILSRDVFELIITSQKIIVVADGNGSSEFTFYGIPIKVIETGKEIINVGYVI